MRQRGTRRFAHHWPVALATAALLVLLAGCSEDDCVNCVEPAPVAPTQVYTVSGDEEVTLFWNDYPEIYDENILGYRIWRREYLGDAADPEREFYFWAEVSVGQNLDVDTGQYHWVDRDVDNAIDYEYAVSAFTASAESYLSFELVIDTPLPMSETPLTLHDVFGDQPQFAGFDFSVAGENGGGSQNGGAGVVDPTAAGSQADVRVRFDGAGVPWMDSTREGVRIQDFGTFTDEDGGLDFSGLSWAPAHGWSESGTVELIAGHIYAVEIWNEFGAEDLHYAKLGVVSIDPGAGTVDIMWAYQLVHGLPELSTEPKPATGEDVELTPIRL